MNKIVAIGVITLLATAAVLAANVAGSTATQQASQSVAPKDAPPSAVLAANVVGSAETYQTSQSVAPEYTQPSATSTQYIAQSADSVASMSLDQLAAKNTDAGAVMIYSTGIGNQYHMRRCIDAAANPNPVIWDCNFASVRQKWILHSSGQIKYQDEISKCLTWPEFSGDQVYRATCQTGATNQIFKFNSNGTIGNGQGKCLNISNGNYGNGTVLLAWDCTASAHELWSIQPDPVVYFTLVSDSSSPKNFVVKGASSSWNSWLDFDASGTTLNSYWFFTPANDGTDDYFIQSAQTGYCLTASGGANIVSDGCKRPGHDASQKWTVRKKKNNSDQFILYNANQNRHLSRNISQTSWSEYPFMWPGTGEDDLLYVKLVVAPGALNVVLSNVNSSGNKNCVSPSADTTRYELIKASCQEIDRYFSAVDILPDNTIRFRLSGKCLDDHESSSPHVAAQWDCNSATSAAKTNQQWFPVKFKGSVAAREVLTWSAFPYGSATGLSSGANGLALTESLMGNGMVLSNDSGSVANASWYISRAYGPEGLGAPLTAPRRCLDSKNPPEPKVYFPEQDCFDQYIAMQPEAYEADAKPYLEWDNRAVNTKYLTEKEALPYLVGPCTVKNIARLCRNGKILNSPFFLTRSSGQTEAQFVLTRDGKLYVFNIANLKDFGDNYTLKHSSFTGGKPVAAAGKVLAINGIIYTVSNDSGHYKPRHGTQAIVNTFLRKYSLPQAQKIVDFESVDHGKVVSDLFMRATAASVAECRSLGADFCAFADDYGKVPP